MQIGVDPHAARSPDQPDRRRRGGRAPGRRAEGAARERARRRRDAGRRRHRGRRRQAHPRRRRRRGHRARRPAARGRAPRDVEDQHAAAISRRSPRSAFAARRWHRSRRCRGLRSRRAQAASRTRGASRSKAARSRRSRPRRLPPARRVTVEELFFNTPARRKFLRTEATEWGALRRGVPPRRARASASRRSRCSTTAASLHRLPAAGRQSRVERCSGDDFVAQRGARRRRRRRRRDSRASRCARRTRRKAAGQYVFVNGRFVRDRVLVARDARGVSRRAASRPPAGVRAVARRSIRAGSTSTCIRRRSRCAFATPAPCTSSCAARSSARSRRRRPSSPRCRRRRSSVRRRRAHVCRRVRRRSFADASQAPLVARSASPSRRRSTRGCSARARDRRPRDPPAADRRRASARLRARAAARHLRARAEPRRPRARRHARGARAHRLRAAEDARTTRACRCSRCWCRRRSPPSRSRSRRWRSTRETLETLGFAIVGARSRDARRARRARAARRRRSGGARARGAARACANSAAAQADRSAPRRAALDHGLPRRGARQPRRSTIAGDERAAARDGSDRARGPVQPRPADLVPADARRSSIACSCVDAESTLPGPRPPDGPDRVGQERARHGARARAATARSSPSIRRRSIAGWTSAPPSRARRARAGPAPPDRHRRSRPRRIRPRASSPMRSARSRTCARAAALPHRRRRHHAVLQGADRGTVRAAARRSTKCARSSMRGPRWKGWPALHAELARVDPGDGATPAADGLATHPARARGVLRLWHADVGAAGQARADGGARSRRLRVALDAAGPRRAARGHRARDSTRCSPPAWSTSSRRCARRYALDSCDAVDAMRRIPPGVAVPGRRDRRAGPARHAASQRRASSPSASSRGCARCRPRRSPPAIAEVVAFVARECAARAALCDNG